MRKFPFVLFVFFAYSVPAYAFGFGDVKAFITGETWPVILTGVLFAFGLFGAVVLGKIIATLRESGEALIAVADALADKKVSKQELDALKDDIRDVVNVWRKTPEEYLPDAPVEPPKVD